MATLLLLNKPYGVLTQFEDKEGRPTLKRFVKKPGFYPAGRLDLDSEGLLLLTDDGGLQHRVAHPSQKLAKTYWVQVEGSPSPESLAELAGGLNLKDGPTLPAKVKEIPEPPLWPRDPPIRYRKNDLTSWLEITIKEGRNRQVRRMTAAVGLPTLRLVRVAIGPWTLSGLLPGELREEQVNLPKPSPSAGRNRPNNTPGRSRRKPKSARIAPSSNKSKS
jgi:23S rRNA pseudouridine2457 synthase